MGCHDALLERVRALLAFGHESQAEAALRRAIAAKGADPLLFTAIGDLLLNAGKFVQAEFYLRRALAIKPDSLEAIDSLAKSLLGQQKPDEGHALLERAIAVQPRNTRPRITLATSLRRLNKAASSLALLKDGLREGVNDAALLNACAHALHAMGRVEEAVPLLRRVVAAMPDNLAILDGLCSVLNYCPGVTPQEVLETHERYGRLVERNAGPRLRPPGAGDLRVPGRPLRIGFLSNDLRDHVVPMFLEPFLTHADRARVHISCFNTSPVEDDVSARLRTLCDNWHWLRIAQPEQVAECISKARIDVLIELNGHTRGQRLEALALRPAPVQMTYLGYPATTGLHTIDYRLVDSTTDPYGADDFVTERLLRIEPCFLCYRPPQGAPPTNIRPDGPITFVSFTNLLKVNTPLLKLWARVLNTVPGSRLMMKHFSLKEQEVRSDLAARLETLGISPDRLDLRPPIDRRNHHLAAYHDADICLDTSPYNGTTTIFESLFMGVPVVTLSGKLHAGRVTESIIRNVGLSDLVSINEDEYVAKAAALVANPARRADLRQTLRERLLQSPLCDEPGYAQRMVDTCYRAWASIGAVTQAPPSTVMPRANAFA